MRFDEISNTCENLCDAEIITMTTVFTKLTDTFEDAIDSIPSERIEELIYRTRKSYDGKGKFECWISILISNRYREPEPPKHLYVMGATADFACDAIESAKVLKGISPFEDFVQKCYDRIIEVYNLAFEATASQKWVTLMVCANEEEEMGANKCHPYGLAKMVENNTNTLINDLRTFFGKENVELFYTLSGLVIRIKV